MRSRLCLFFFLCSCGLFAQDTIFKKNKERVLASVIESGVVIKYHLADLPDGPVYSIPKNDVRYIHYADGRIESFEIQEELPVTRKSTPSSTIPPGKINLNNPQEAINIYHNSYTYNGRRLNENALLNLAAGKRDDKVVQGEILLVKRARTNQHIVTFGGDGMLIVGSVMLSNGLNANNFNPTLAANGFLLMLGGGLISSTAIVFKKVRKRHLHNLAEAYNNTLF
jgi:hypothetical protein